jgi:CrcB protein
MTEVAGFAWVCAGAAVGAPARYLVDRFVQARHDAVLPWGTLCVNVVGSFVLGVLTGLGGGHRVAELAVGTGFCGALTTYSTFSYETLRLYEDGARLYAAINVALSVGAGLAAAVAGVGAGRLLA